ncbi:hypothetical protein EJ02DRAFT_482434 [Clathrospora elynae]|uniref:HCP-like protein n=1 Tax=Clathrospora elynae TaxID=706981 RepID=A0A6A5SWH4_9PLEO|nr:hypothetical protein EJ02DRAFT_482434 [Clathrospora elynae]
MAYQQHGHHAQPQQQYHEQGRSQQRQQQQPGYNQQYDQQYDQQHYDYGYDQGGHEQWDNGHYEQQGGWGNAQQHGGYQDANGYSRQAPQSQGRGQPVQDHQGRRPPPQEQAYHELPSQHPPQQRQDPRSRPTGRGNGLPPNPQQGRGGLRPPGLDRSLLNPVVPKSLPQDNPFPIFPSPKPKQGGPKDTIEQGMAQMNIKDKGAQSNQKRPPTRGQPMPQQIRGVHQEKPDTNPRQDSGNFEGQGQTQRHPPNRMPPGQRMPPTNMDGARAPPPQRLSDPKSPSQRAFGPNTQRSVTMPQSLPSGGQGRGYDGQQQQWAEPAGVSGYYGNNSPDYIPPRPSTAGGVRQNGPQRHQEQRPPVPHSHSQQQPQQQQRYQPHHEYQAPNQHYPSQGEAPAALDTLYDDYYEESNDRKSLASTVDMPNFDAIPETSNKHRRGDSIDNHLSPSSPAMNNSFQTQALKSRSQPDLHELYASDGAHEMAGDAPPMPNLPRANTGFAGANGLANGPRGRGPPPRGMTADGMQRGAPAQGFAPGQLPNFDPRHARQPPPGHRGYSDDSAYSQPPLRNFAPLVGPGNPIARPGTAGPALGRVPNDLLGRRPGTAQTHSNPDALPAHPMPVRAGLMQQNQQQQQQQQSVQTPGPQGTRPPPIRQYNSEGARTSLESQHPIPKRQSAAAHPVTYDELNRLRNTFKTNPADIATGLILSKKLVEASSVLADEGGTADTRSKNKNREKFVLEAHKIIKKLVSAGSPDAMFFLADCYGQGLLGLQVDTKEAFTLYQSAAKGGHAASAYRTAVCCEMGHEEGGGTKRDALKAVQWYRRAAALGDTPALYKMGMVLLKGLLGQQKNFGEAINMLKRAADRADRDNPHALHELALIYEADNGNQRIIHDEAYALQLFHQAADLGYKFSQFRLGQSYEYGLLGVPIDARTSIAWYTKAAAQEEHQSELALSGWYLTGTSGILEQSDTEAFLWARKAACAEPPLPKALFAMGYFTEVGIGCPRSLDEAKRWYGRAAAYKFPKAQERLEELKRGGSKVQMKRERLSRTNQKQQEENCTVM